MKYKIPTEIETERLKLRFFKEEDWQDLTAYYADAECMRYTTGRALADWEVWRKIAEMIGHWEIRGFGPYAMEEQKTGKVLGPAGLWFPLEWPEPEIKWGLAKNYWGKGFAREAATAVRDMAAKFVPEYHLISLISVGNVNSIKLAKSMGATYEKTIPFRSDEAFIYRHRYIK
jgi:RimJ/RimL family protein N-acetyltransferase